MYPSTNSMSLIHNTTVLVVTANVTTRNFLSQKQWHTYPCFLFKCNTKCIPSYNNEYPIKYI